MTKKLICLHGWGGSSESFTELREALKDSDIKMFAPDLPGFGNEPEPDSPWTNDDYTDWVESYIKKYIDGEFMLLGHSHGGRIAAKLAARKSLPISQLYLCAAAGIQHRHPIKRSIGWILSKTFNLILSIPGLNKLKPIAKRVLYKLFRVHDYEKASDVMRETFKKVSTEEIRTFLPDINIPTKIFWGEDDSMTPVSDGKLMNEMIANSTLITFPNIRHRIHRDRAKQIADVIQKK